MKKVEKVHKSAHLFISFLFNKQLITIFSVNSQIESPVHLPMQKPFLILIQQNVSFLSDG